MKDEKDVITEKPAKEFVETSPRITPFLPSLKATQTKQVEVPGGQMTTQPVADKPFAWAESYAKNYVEQSTPVADPFKAFSERQSA